MAEENNKFAGRLQELRKEKNWSQPQLGKMIGTSGAIIGRYERCEITPSISVANKLADVFDVTLDYLVADRGLPSTLQDKPMLNRWEAIENLPSEDQRQILSVLDSLVRDAQARQTYGINP